MKSVARRSMPTKASSCRTRRPVPMAAAPAQQAWAFAKREADVTTSKAPAKARALGNGDGRAEGIFEGGRHANAELPVTCHREDDVGDLVAALALRGDDGNGRRTVMVRGHVGLDLEGQVVAHLLRFVVVDLEQELVFAAL